MNTDALSAVICPERRPELPAMRIVIPQLVGAKVSVLCRMENATDRVSFSPKDALAFTSEIGTARANTISRVTYGTTSDLDLAARQHDWKG
jgi:hypothetical protein